jgi:hypothetical protein
MNWPDRVTVFLLLICSLYFWWHCLRWAFTF